MVRIHDTLLRDTVELVARAGQALDVRVRTDGLRLPHVGHGRTAVVFDMIRRYLEWAGFDVTYVSNVTDVEDQIIARAAAEDGPSPSWRASSRAVYFDQHGTGSTCAAADHAPRHRVHRRHAR